MRALLTATLVLVVSLAMFYSASFIWICACIHLIWSAWVFGAVSAFHVMCMMAVTIAPVISYGLNVLAHSYARRVDWYTHEKLYAVVTITFLKLAAASTWLVSSGLFSHAIWLKIVTGDFSEDEGRIAVCALVPFALALYSVYLGVARHLEEDEGWDGYGGSDDEPFDPGPDPGGRALKSPQSGEVIQNYFFKTLRFQFFN